MEYMLEFPEVFPVNCGLLAHSWKEVEDCGADGRIPEVEKLLRQICEDWNVSYDRGVLN